MGVGGGGGHITMTSIIVMGRFSCLSMSLIIAANHSIPSLPSLASQLEARPGADPIPRSCTVAVVTRCASTAGASPR